MKAVTARYSTSGTSSGKGNAHGELYRIQLSRTEMCCIVCNNIETMHLGLQLQLFDGAQ